MDAARTAQQTLNDALETEKHLKAKSRDAKRRVKAAKKTAKRAAKDARAARKAANSARRKYKKAVARVAKMRAKAAKGKEERIVTPKRTSPSRNHPPARRADRANKDRQRDWDVGEDAADNGAAVSGSATAS